MLISSLSILQMLTLTSFLFKKQNTSALNVIRRITPFISKNCISSSTTVSTHSFFQNAFVTSPDKLKTSNPYKRTKSIFLSTLENSSSEESATSAASNNNAPSTTIELSISSVEDLEDTGSILSINTNSGDIIFLDGDLGAGKTCFARGFIRAKVRDFDTLVTSPTYLLSNTYSVDEENITIHHMDLYRLSDQATDFQPLNLPFVFKNCISLIEWPIKLKASNCTELIPSEYLDVQIKIHENNPNVRLVSLTPFGRNWESRIQFLIDEGYFDDLIVS